MLGVEVKDLIFARISADINGEKKTRWIVASDRKFIPAGNQADWGFPRFLYGEATHIYISIIPYEEMSKKDLKKLKYGVDAVCSGLEKSRIVPG